MDWEAHHWVDGVLDPLGERNVKDEGVRRRRVSEIHRALALALAHDLTARTEGRMRMLRQAVIIIDRYDYLEEHAEINDSIATLAQRLHAECARVVVAISRREVPPRVNGTGASGRLLPGEYWRKGANADFGHFLIGDRIEVHQLPLLSRKNARYFLAGAGVTPKLSDSIIDVAGGHPLALQLSVDAVKGGGDGIEELAVELGAASESDPQWVSRVCLELSTRIFKELSDRRKLLLRAAAIPRRFGERVLIEMLGSDLSDEDYRWLVTSDFAEDVTPTHESQAEAHRLMTFVRTALLRSNAERRLMQGWNERVITMLAADADEAGDDDSRFAIKVGLLYHRELLDPTDDSLRQFEELLSEALQDERDDRCADLLSALHDLRPGDPRLQAKTLELEGRFYAKRQRYALAERRLRGAQAIHPLTATSDDTAVAISYTLSRCLRLRGENRAALEELRRLKPFVEDEPVAAFLTTWQESLAQKMLGATDKALKLADVDARALLAEARRESRKQRRPTLSPVAIVDLGRAEAHLDRHVAELLRRGGDYAGAHLRLDRALERYEANPEDEAVAHARLARADILRLEGLYDLARAEADAARRSFVALGRRHGELMALSTLGRTELDADSAAAWDYFNAVVDQPQWIYPAGSTRGHVGIAELYRRHQKWRESERHFAQAIAACPDPEAIEVFEARIGLAALACMTNKRRASGHEGRDVAMHARARANPLLRVQANLVVACADSDTRKRALADAEGLLARFVRRDLDRRPDEAQVAQLRQHPSVEQLRLVHL